MVNNPDTHGASTGGRREPGPGPLYWLVALLLGPLMSCAVGAVLFPRFHSATGDWLVVALAALLGGALGSRAVSEDIFSSGARAFWVGLAAVLAVAIPVGVAFTLLLMACSGGRCSS